LKAHHWPLVNSPEKIARSPLVKAPAFEVEK
jgi:hypothetical protein